jgi:hypothetical protein
VPDIVYQQYQPSNAIELREYMMFIMAKDQQLYLENARNLEEA